MKKTVAVIFGGKSAEHEVSIITGHLPIIRALEAGGQYEVLPVYIAVDGSWYSDPAMSDLGYFKGDYAEKVRRLPKLRFGFEGGGLTLIWPGLMPRTKKVDIAFPAMHGTYGEDGSLMGLLRMAGIPFVGCDIFASAVAMDKVLTKQVLAAEGIPVVPYLWFVRSDWQDAAAKAAILEKAKGLVCPLFVKPVHLGSSIGIAKVKNENELLNAVEVALHYDDKVLIEEAVPNLIEVTLPIMGNEDPQPALVQRSFAEDLFLDFERKYISGGKKTGSVNAASVEMPAKIGDELLERVTDLGIRTYKTLGCEGISRVDFLIDSGTSEVYVNEVNTLPGSLYDHNWRKAGVSNVELVTRLIGYAEERALRQRETTFAFASGILDQVGGTKFGS